MLSAVAVVPAPAAPASAAAPPASLPRGAAVDPPALLPVVDHHVVPAARNSAAVWQSAGRECAQPRRSAHRSRSSSRIASAPLKSRERRRSSRSCSIASMSAVSPSDPPRPDCAYRSPPRSPPRRRPLLDESSSTHQLFCRSSTMTRKRDRSSSRISSPPQRTHPPQRSHARAASHPAPQVALRPQSSPPRTGSPVQAPAARGRRAAARANPAAGVPPPLRPASGAWWREASLEVVARGDVSEKLHCCSQLRQKGC